MTIEEAIKLLHPNTTGEGIMEIQYYGVFEAKENVIKAIEEACILACEALEKQIPKKPIKLDDWGEYYKCPICDKYAVDNLGCKHKFCRECGQRIDWKVEE